MHKNALAEVLERVKAWPEEDQETLADYARAIEAQRTGVYVMTSEERGSVEQGLAEAARGEFATDSEMQELRKRYGAK